MRNKLLFTFVMMLFVFSLVFSAMALDPEPKVEVAKVEEYQGRAVDVSVSVTDAAIAGAVFDVAFDSDVLVPVSVTCGTADADALVVSNVGTSPITSVKTVWLYSKAGEGENIPLVGGVLYTIRFEVKDDAQGLSNLTVTYSEGNVSNANFENVNPATLNGSVNALLLPTATAPTADKANGKYKSGEKVTLASQENTEIYYTTDNTLPTTSSNKYTLPITLTEDVTIRAISVATDGMKKTSPEATFVYNVITPTQPLLEVEVSKAKPGDENVEVKISLANNPGISNLSFKIAHSSDIQLVGFEDSGVIANGTTTVPPQGTAFNNPFEIFIGNEANEISTANGTLCVLKFNVPAAAEDGLYNITLSDVSVPELETWDGGLYVRSYVLGDLNEDGKVNKDDAIYLLKHTQVYHINGKYPVNQPVDYNKDVRVNKDDAIYLLKHTQVYHINGKYPLS